MRRVYALCATAGLALSALAATSPAEAAFHLIRWDNTGFCQVRDDSWVVKPLMSNYKTVSRPIASFGDALAVKDRLLKTGTCKF